MGRSKGNNAGAAAVPLAAQDGSFQGDDDILVDRLVAASRKGEERGAGEPLPGFGRDLAPFFDENTFADAQAALQAREDNVRR